jgi:hypothetical protein
MKRLKTFQQHKVKKADVSTDDLKPQSTDKHAAEVFTADEMDVISVVGNEVELLTDEEKEKNITKQD